MHFSKTYSRLLLTLPDELRTSAIEYSQLKKLINQLVAELESLGLSPRVLHELLQQDHESQPSLKTPPFSQGTAKGKERAWDETLSGLEDGSKNILSVSLPAPLHRVSLPSAAKVVYELADVGQSGDVVPQLRLWFEASSLRSHSPSSRGVLDFPEDPDDAHGSSLSPSPNDSRAVLSVDTESASPTSSPAGAKPGVQHSGTGDDVVIMSSPVAPRARHDLLWSLQELPAVKCTTSWSAVTNKDIQPHYMGNGLDNPVTHDRDNDHQFIIPLASDTAFFRLLTHALNALSAALGASREDFISSIEALSRSVARTSRPASARGKSDLYIWRAIFQLYMEAQVFESTSERDRGERSIEDSETRLAHFARRVGESGFNLRMAASRDSLERFLELNVRLMNLKKFQNANAEATRKILKKHTKRTALPLPNSAMELIPALEIRKAAAMVPHVLVVALTETLMTVVPHIDDYLCLICTAIAFKPIRLKCGHLFCVRCLVKMQKQGKGNCPVCRAPTVIIADKSNVDYALINFMRDWFPKETKEKAKENEYESTKEEMEELGLDTRCTVM